MRRIAVLAAVLVALTGCAAPFMYDNVSYYSREAALAAAHADVDRRVSGVTVSNQKIKGSLLVVVPTRLVIDRHTTREFTGYLTEVNEIGFLGIPAAIKKAQIFDSVEVVRSANMEWKSEKEYDYKLWLTVERGEQPQWYVSMTGEFHRGPPGLEWQWYLMKTGDFRRQPVSLDPGLPGPAKLLSFNGSLLKAASLTGAVITASAPAKEDAPSSGADTRKSGTGTGFFINAGGFAVTNAHVVDGCDALRAILPDGNTPAISVIAADPVNDLALLKVNTKNGGVTQFRLSPTVRQGEQIILYGYPLTDTLASKGSLSTGVVSALAGLYDDTRELQISAPVQPGNSGGPVLDQYGNVIGVVRRKLNALLTAKVTGDIPQNVNFAIKSGVVAAFLEANGMKFSTAAAKKELSTADLGDKAKTFTFMVECY